MGCESQAGGGWHRLFERDHAHGLEAGVSQLLDEHLGGGEAGPIDARVGGEQARRPEPLGAGRIDRADDQAPTSSAQGSGASCSASATLPGHPAPRRRSLALSPDDGTESERAHPTSALARSEPSRGVRACTFVAAEALEVAADVDAPQEPEKLPGSFGSQRRFERVEAGALYLTAGYDANAAVCGPAARTAACTM